MSMTALYWISFRTRSTRPFFLVNRVEELTNLTNLVAAFRFRQLVSHHEHRLAVVHVFFGFGFIVEETRVHFLQLTAEVLQAFRGAAAPVS